MKTSPSPLSAAALLLVVVALTTPLLATGESHAASSNRTTDSTAVKSGDVLDAASQGNETSMRRLTGQPISLTGRPESLLRESVNYREFIVWTGPDFRLGKSASGFDVVVRIPTSIAPDKLPELIQAEGQISDFVRADTIDHSHENSRVKWMPVITITILK